jgi:hypothetical protein
METVVTMARSIRVATGSPGSQVLAGGFSRGAEVSVAFVNHDAQLAPQQRNARGVVLIDYTSKFPASQSSCIQAACQRALRAQGQYAAGVYGNNTGLIAQTLGTLDATTPNLPSLIFPGNTNHQALVLVLANTYLIADLAPWYHFGAGVHSILGLPTDLRYTQLEYMRAWAMNSPGYQPTLELLESDQLLCGMPSPMVDHLAQVTMPVFYLGAQGGFGDTGLEMLNQFGSADKTSVIVQLAASSNRLADFGHADLMFADNAPTLGWSHIANWIASH